MDILIQATQLILSLSLLVLIHEFGHFIFSRMSKVRVDKFYLFFNPWGSIVRAKRYEGRWHFSWFSGAPPKDWNLYPDNTEWGIGWLPFGGYCKISGMIDESMDKEHTKQPPQAWEYRSKAPWRRALISGGGVLFNFASALVIYSLVLFAWGKEVLPLKNITWGFNYSQAAKDAGFEDGDLIVSIDGTEPKTMGEAIEQLLLSDGKTAAVRRKDRIREITLPADFSQKVLAEGIEKFAEARYPFVIKEVKAGGAAQAAGLLAGDSIVGLNGVSPIFAGDLIKRLAPLAGQSAELMLYRRGWFIIRSVTLSSEAKMDVGIKTGYDFFKTEKQTYGFWAAIPAGVSLGVQRLVSYVRQFKIVFTREGAKSVGGIVAIGNLFPPVWDWAFFWNITAFLSIMIAFLNILPFPAFDGGHMMFAFYEMVTRRKPRDKFMERSQVVGMIILILLLVYANGNDLLRFFFR